MNKHIRELLLYAIVGAIATAAEWLIFLGLDKCLMHYIPATALAYVISTFVNWLAGRLLVFKNNRSSLWRELAGIYAVSVIGLALNLLIMWIAVDLLSVNGMLSKITATALVFLYNFMARKKFIYKKRNRRRTRKNSGTE